MAFANTVTLQVQKQIKERESGGRKAKALTLDDYMKSHFNTIQGSIISFLEPMARKFAYQVVHGYLEVWKASSNLTKIGMNTNEGCEKIIQMLLSLQIEPHEVLRAVNEWTMAHGYHTLKQGKKEVTLSRDEKGRATLQSLICHLVYTYLAHCITPNFAHQNAREQKEAAEQSSGGERVDHALESLLKLNGNAMKFFGNFIHTRHPTTICWLLEILLLLTHKFKPQGNKLQKSLKQEYSQLLD